VFEEFEVFEGFLVSSFRFQVREEWEFEEYEESEGFGWF
jgi:hypothetical protein